MALVRCLLGKVLRGSLPLLFPVFRRSHLSPPGASTSATTLVIIAAKGGTMSEKGCPVILPTWRSIHAIRDLLHAANLRHGTDGFTSPLKEGVLRIFSPLKIRRLRPGFKLRTWVLKANTLPLDHRSRFAVLCLDSGNDQEQPKQFLTFLSLFNRLGDRYVCNCFLQQKSSSITMSVQYVTLQYFKFYNP